jgi:UDP-N-acetylmuramoyl-tripeptide--D-alanyl-D-alanine ligase
MRFDEYFLQMALPDAVVLEKNFPSTLSFSVDTRSLKKGDIYIALEGSRVDGHSFITEALEAGAAGIFLAICKKHLLETIDSVLLKKKLIVLVPDTLSALIKMATVWRSQFTCPIIAITGSVGKTSTKEMLVSILEVHKAKYLASQGNQNTKIGLSLNIMRMRPEHEFAIFELGINKRGEMAQLVSILRPTTGVITYVGHSHMEGLGSLTDIAQEKRDIFKYFTEDSIGIINGDQAILSTVSYTHPVIKFGSKTINQIQARKIHVGNNHVTFVLKLYKDKIPVTLKNTNVGRVFNCLAAAAAAYVMGIPKNSILQGLQVPIAVHGRFEIRPLARGKGSIINDCYNASPESMKAALLALEHVDTDAQKVAVLGDMLELGVNSPFWHRQIGRFLRKVPSLKTVILVGDMIKWTKKTIPIGVQVKQVTSWQEAVNLLEEFTQKDCVVLVKGSRGMQLDHLVEHFAPTNPPKHNHNETNLR